MTAGFLGTTFEGRQLNRPVPATSWSGQAEIAEWHSAISCHFLVQTGWNRRVALGNFLPLPGPESALLIGWNCRVALCCGEARGPLWPLALGVRPVYPLASLRPPAVQLTLMIRGQSRQQLLDGVLKVGAACRDWNHESDCLRFSRCATTVRASRACNFEMAFFASVRDSPCHRASLHGVIKPLAQINHLEYFGGW